MIVFSSQNRELFFNNPFKIHCAEIYKVIKKLKKDEVLGQYMNFEGDNSFHNNY